MIKSRQHILWLGLTGLIASVGLVSFRADTLSLDSALLAIAIMWVGLIPSVAYLHQPKADRAPFPLMPLTGIFYAVFFGFPAFIAYYLMGSNDTRIEYYGHRYLDAISPEAQILILVGVGLMLLSWRIGKKYLFRSIPLFTLPEPRDERSSVCLAWGLALVNLAYWTVPEIRSLPSIGQFLQPAGFLAFTIFYLIHLRGALSRTNKIFYFLMALPVWSGSLLATGSLTPLLYLLVLWFALRFMVTRTIPWGLLLAGPLFFFLVYPHLQEFRGRYWGSGESGSTFEKVIEFSKIVGSRTLEEGIGSQKGHRPLTHLVRRVSLILPLSQVVETTPDPVSYWNGETYQTLFTGWIPRVIWRDKPKEIWGNVFGRKFNIIAPEDKSNSINIPWITEMYANFGRTGVLLGMTLVGLFLGLLDRFLNSPNRNIEEQAVAATVLLPLFFQESNFTLMTGSLLPLILCFWLLFTVGFRIPIPWPART